MKYRYSLIVLLTFFINLLFAQQDTLKVMAYNVLHYGDGCQGSNTFLHKNLKAIIQYTSPDVLGLVKAQAIRINASDFDGISHIGFADSIIKFALDSATYKGKYAYCTLTRVSNDADGDMDILFYNQSKLGFVSVTNLCSYQEDFDLYKLYYKDPYVSSTHDTTFIYIVLNHTVSGSSTTDRDNQDTTVIKSLKTFFYHLPNLISMGDFNTHTSTENGYELYTATSDTSFIFDDPPFYPDGKFTYPQAWSNKISCSGYLNTSTRATNIPNGCGASGGAKDWYEHIFLSKWITGNIDFMKYVTNSYQTIGNDGKHFNSSINDSTGDPKNTSAPSNVINALFQLSDKYPIMVKLAVTYDSLGNGPADPVVNGINKIIALQDKIEVNNPVHDFADIHFPPELIGQKASIHWYDISGRLVNSKEFSIITSLMNIEIHFAPGIYMLNIRSGTFSVTRKIVKE